MLRKQQPIEIMGTSSAGAEGNHTRKRIFVSQVDSAFFFIYCYIRKDNLWDEDSKSVRITTKSESIRVCIESVLSL